MEAVLKLLIVLRLLKAGVCTIGGLTYMDRLSMRPLPNDPAAGQDPCKPLYWYPRPIPEYCSYKFHQRPPAPPSQPIPMPIPVPMPPMPPPVFMAPIFPQPIYPQPMPPPIYQQPISPPMIPPMFPPPIPIPYGVPLAPTNPMIPVGGTRYAGLRRQVGLVPGLPGLVSPDGGINILPFSDAYSDLLEKHKQKMIRKRLEKVLDNYDRFPYKRHKPHEDCRRYDFDQSVGI